MGRWITLLTRLCATSPRILDWLMHQSTGNFCEYRILYDAQYRFEARKVCQHAECLGADIYSRRWRLRAKMLAHAHAESIGSITVIGRSKG